MAETHQPPAQTGYRRGARIGLFAGPIVALIVYVLLPDVYMGVDSESVTLGSDAHAAAAIASWMAVWWMTEAISVYVTALLPLVLFPLAGVAPIRATAASYGHEIIFLFLGGFIVALALERWQLHKRLALTVLAAVRPRPRAIVGGFMVVSAALSMWVTNTATTIMLLPVALSVINMLPDPDRSSADGPRSPSTFAVCLLLGIAYAASIGGMGTIIGTAPNVFVVSFVQDQMQRQIGFVEWMTFAVPLVLVLVPVVWWMLTRWIYPLDKRDLPGATAVIEDARRSLRAMGRGDRLTLMIFLLTALAWLTRPLLNKLAIAGMQPLAGLTDSGIAVLAAVTLFVTPVNLKRGEFLMDWQTAVRLPWGLLLLFGGGLALAAALTETGFSLYLGSLASAFRGWQIWLTTLSVTAIVIFLTELTSNTATTATFVPVLLAVAVGLGISPLILIIPAALAASCAFMLPVATPPNAIVFGSGMLHINQMARAGFWLNLVAIGIITASSYAILVPVLGIAL
jgi:sodium-dependent dicarboxylate transporter 2/3/5